jgi:hypothetical protein
MVQMNANGIQIEYHPLLLDKGMKWGYQKVPVRSLHRGTALYGGLFDVETRGIYFY